MKLPKRSVWMAAGVMVLMTSIAKAQPYARVDGGIVKSFGADIKDKNFALDGGICGNANCNLPGTLDDVGSSASVGGGIGYRFSPKVRADVVVALHPSYSLNQADKSSPATTFTADVSAVTVMANAYYDIPTTGKVTPYIGGGIGLARNTIDTPKAVNSGLNFTFPGGSANGLAAGVAAGLGVPMSEAVTFDIGYRFTTLGDLNTDAGTYKVNGANAGTYSGAAGSLMGHAISVGVRFNLSR